MSDNKLQPGHKNLALCLALLVILLLAFAVRVNQLNNIPLNLDEIRSINRYVPLPLFQNFTTFDSNNHAMASALAHIFSPQGDNLFLLRWPLVLLGMISLPFIYRLGASLFGWKVGIVALFLLSFTPAYIGYSVTMRGYVGLISLTVISLFFLARAVQFNRWLDWIGFALANAMIIHFHLFGVIATWTQVGLIGFWLIWQQFFSKKPQNNIWKKFSLAVIFLVGVQLPVIYLRAISILNNETWTSTFEAWRDNNFALAEELQPVFQTIRFIAPMSLLGIGFYIYLFFFAAGLFWLWQKKGAFWVFGIMVWFIAPFAAILFATQLSETFYAYERFTFYLLPSFLMVVALGMVSSATWLLQTVGNYGQNWQLAVKGGIGICAIGFVGLFVISTQWYLLTITSINWWHLAQTLSASRQSQDIIICEEPHGFDVPDRAKAYCIWMLDFFMPQVDEYTSKFQSSTNFVANYEYLQEHRTEMLDPGGVWLVLWHRNIFHPGQLVTNQKPVTDSVMLPSGVENYTEAWQFGQAVLVYVNSEPTLFDNLLKSVELLSQSEGSASADQARYYRSLAEMEAFRGQRLEAQHYYDQSWAVVETLGNQYPDLFLLDTTPLIERLPPSEPVPGTGVSVDYLFDTALCLNAYELKPESLIANQPLILTLYWQATGQISTDYAFFLQLIDEAGLPQGRFDFDLFNHTYPTPWWWPGLRLVDHQQFAIPAELPVKHYTVLLGAYDRLNPTVETVQPLFQLVANTDGKGWRVAEVESTVGPYCSTGQEK